VIFMVVKAAQNRSRSAHLVFAYSRLRPWLAAHDALLLDLFCGFQGKFLRIFGVNHESRVLRDECTPIKKGGDNHGLHE
jgi:hypothetical protein